MKSYSYSKITFFFLLILTLLSFSNAIAQLEESPLSQIKALKSKSNFDSSNPEYIDLLIHLALSKIHSNPDSTATLLKESYELSLSTNYRIGESRSLAVYGYYYSTQGEMDKAYENNKNALQIANTYGLYIEKIKALNNLGLDYWYQGNHASALTHFLEALTVAKESDSDMITGLNNNIALLYDSNGDYETALEFYEVAKQLSIKNNNEQILASVLLNMSGVYILQEKFIEADRDVDESIKIFEKLESKEWMANAYTVKGDIAVGKGNNQKALKWFKKSEKLCDELNFIMGYTATYKSLADIYLKLGDLINAEKYALSGLQFSKDLNITENATSFYLILSELYNKKGAYKKAYDYEVKYRLLYEEGVNEKLETNLGISLTKMKYKNQKEILTEEKNTAIARQNIYIYSVIAALVFVSLLLLLIFRTNRLQKKYTQDLQEKQDALIIHDAELIESNKTKDKLFSIIAHDLRGPIGSFHSLMQLHMDNSISKEESDYILPKALQEIQGISRMLNNLLVWAKTQMTGIEIKQENIDLKEIVEETVLLLTPFAESKKILIQNSIPPNTISFSDKDSINVIMRNLISNAIKFTNSNGEVVIDLIEKDNKLQIEVSDNGVGMDAETLNNLFQKNNTISTYGTNNEKGTGLGLTLSKEMVESNGGELWGSSVKNQGTSIFFTVPKKSYS